MNDTWPAAAAGGVVITLAVWLFVVVIRLNATYKSENYPRLRKQIRAMWLPVGLFEISVGVMLICLGNYGGAPGLILFGLLMVGLWRIYPRLYPPGEPDLEDRRDVERWLDEP